MSGSKTLVIVESPAKAKTIEKYLGSGYQLTASKGHIRDLPSMSLGVEVKNDFRPRYITMRGKEKVIKELKALAEKSDRVLIATDPDREGEAIAWHIANLLKIDPLSPCRISFNEITKPAVQAAVAHPRPIDMDLVDAQQARRVLDRLVGYELSPLLWKKIRKGLSAGRVQSVATRMIVEREEEIEAFQPEEYWNLDAELMKGEEISFLARYHGERQANNKVKKTKISTGEEAQTLLQDARKQDFSVKTLVSKDRKRQPYAPFTTSTLQQDASRRLGFSAKKTMSVAQQLYEGVDLGERGSTALVTYIRSDSVRSSKEAVEAIREFIVQNYGESYRPDKPRVYKNKNAAQDAHEAIRPAHFELPPEKIKSLLSSDQFRLYRLIWERFVASQMESALVTGTTADIDAGTHVFRVTGEVMRFPGFLRVYQNIEEDEAQSKALPPLQEGDNLQLKKLHPEQKFTLPPPRYNEASLIKAMEEEGIGRPSTYAPTLSTILERQYAEKENKALHPTKLGRTVTEMLRENFSKFISVKFTANMEEALDTVESGQQNWVALMNQFYPDFHSHIEAAEEKVQKIELPVIETGEICPECGGRLLIKEGRYGQFVACSNFPTCKFTKNIQENLDAHCPLCGGNLQSRRSKRGNKFYLCAKDAGDPQCSFISWDLPIDHSHCETCGSYMVMHRYRNRLYKMCSNPDCPSRKKKTKKSEEKPGEQG